MAIRKKAQKTSTTNSEDKKIMPILMHILGIFLWFIPALVVYLVAEDKFTKDNAKNALNWQLSTIIYGVISAILVIVLIGILFLAILGLANLVFCIVAAIKAGDGKAWEYPFTIKIIKA